MMDTKKLYTVIEKNENGLNAKYRWENGVEFRWSDWLLCRVKWHEGNPEHCCVASSFRPVAKGDLDCTIFNPSYDPACRENFRLSQLHSFEPISVIDSQICEREQLAAIKEANEKRYEWDRTLDGAITWNNGVTFHCNDWVLCSFSKDYGLPVWDVIASHFCVRGGRLCAMIINPAFRLENCILGDCGFFKPIKVVWGSYAQG